MVIIVCLYMNVMLILNSNEYKIKSIKKILNSKFDVKYGYCRCYTKNEKNCPNFIILKNFSINFWKVTIIL